MTLLTLQLLTAAGGKSTEGNTLINLDILADGGRLADNDAGSVIDEEIFADGCARVDINTGRAVSILCHDTRDQRHLKLEQLVRETIDRDRLQTRIRKNNLLLGVSSRIAVKGCLQIGFQKSADLWKCVEESNRQTLCLHMEFAVVGVFVIRRIFERQLDLLIQTKQRILDQYAGTVLHNVDLVGGVPEIARIHDLHQIVDDLDDHKAVRLGEQFHFVDGTVMRVIVQNGVDNIIYIMFYNFIHVIQSSFLIYYDVVGVWRVKPPDSNLYVNIHCYLLLTLTSYYIRLCATV